MNTSIQSHITNLVFGTPAVVTEVVIANVSAQLSALIPECAMKKAFIYDGDLPEVVVLYHTHFAFPFYTWNISKNMLLCLGLQCESGMVYQECGSTCAASCWSQSEDEDCSTVCVEGCHCPNGTVLQNGQCIERQECPCKVGSIEVPSGYVLKYNCMDW